MSDRHLTKRGSKFTTNRHKTTGIIKCDQLSKEYLDKYYGTEYGMSYNIEELYNAIKAIKNLVGDETKLTALLSIREPAPLLIFPLRANDDDPCLALAPIVDRKSKWWHENGE